MASELMIRNWVARLSLRTSGHALVRDAIRWGSSGTRFWFTACGWAGAEAHIMVQTAADHHEGQKLRYNNGTLPNAMKPSRA